MNSEEQEKQRAIEEQILSYSKKIDFYISEYTIEILAQKVANKEYFVPDYQREFTWDEPRKSKFIESILMGLPIPFIFFWQNDETGKLEIVDGSQRLRTLEEYLHNRLKLNGLERLERLNGTNFEDLPKSRQRKVLNKSIRGIILSDETDIEARIDLFERINTSSKVANPSEIRRGVLRGEFLNLITELSKSESFSKLAPVSAKQKKEREAEELVSRFFAYSDGLDDYRDQVSPFIFQYIKKMNENVENNPKLILLYKSKFEKMLNFVEASFPFGFRKTEKAKTTPRTRFESIAIGSYLALEKKPNLTVSPEEANKILSDEKWLAIIRSDGANSIRRLKERIEFMRDALLARG